MILRNLTSIEFKVEDLSEYNAIRKSTEALKDQKGRPTGSVQKPKQQEVQVRIGYNPHHRKMMWSVFDSTLKSSFLIFIRDFIETFQKFSSPLEKLISMAPRSVFLLYNGVVSTSLCLLILKQNLNFTQW